VTATLAEPLAVVEFRSGDGYQVADVDFPKRIVTVLAMPYERETMIHEPSGSFTEVVSRNAFDGIEKRTGKVRANRDHSWDRPVGKIVALHPSRQEGLVAEVKISRTTLGQETLELCEDDVLSASAGFGLLRRDDGRVWDDAEVWERNRAVRRLNRLWLDHLAFVPNPAYPDAAVISVRRAVSPQEPPTADVAVEATPNRDRIAMDALKAARDELNRKYATR
jgi:HK97 family phage prohead protease